MKLTSVSAKQVRYELSNNIGITVPKNGEFDLVRIVITMYNNPDMSYEDVTIMLNINSARLKKFDSAAKKSGYVNMSDALDAYLNEDTPNELERRDEGAPLVPVVTTDMIGNNVAFEIFLDGLNNSSLESLHNKFTPKKLENHWSLGNFVVVELVKLNSVGLLPNSINEIKRLPIGYEGKDTIDGYVRRSIAASYTAYFGGGYMNKQYEPNDIPDIDIYADEILEYIVDFITNTSIYVKIS